MPAYRNTRWVTTVSTLQNWSTIAFPQRLGIYIVQEELEFTGKTLKTKPRRLNSSDNSVYLFGACTSSTIQAQRRLQQPFMNAEPPGPFLTSRSCIAMLTDVTADDVAPRFQQIQPDAG